MLAAEAAIGSGSLPAIARDDYLDIGDDIGNLALVYDWCYDAVGDRRDAWLTYANQAVSNVWNPDTAMWGTTSAKWTGWAIDDPEDNYYYSFLRATMLLGLAAHGEHDGIDAWLTQFHDTKLVGELVPNFNANLVGGGSREGTGYGVSLRTLWELYDFWNASTTEDIATMTPQTRASMLMFIHETLPTLDRIAPTGDQSRDSTASFFDYHRAYLEELVHIFPNDPLSPRVLALLRDCSVPEMGQEFMYAYDFMLASDTAPTMLDGMGQTYYAPGAGQFYSRSGWDTHATWINMNAGPYTESHAHQDQGALMIYKDGWLAYDPVIDSHSGLPQLVADHGTLRFGSAAQGQRHLDGARASPRHRLRPHRGGPRARRERRREPVPARARLPLARYRRDLRPRDDDRGEQPGLVARISGDADDQRRDDERHRVGPHAEHPAARAGWRDCDGALDDGRQRLPERLPARRDARRWRRALAARHDDRQLGDGDHRDRQQQRRPHAREWYEGACLVQREQRRRDADPQRSDRHARRGRRRTSRVSSRGDAALAQDNVLLLPTVVGVSFVAVLLLFAVRAELPPESLVGSSDAVGNYLQTVGGIYAVLLAFIVYVVWGQFNDARTYVEREATALVDLHRTASGLPRATRIEIQDALGLYVDQVLALEWPAMATHDEDTLENVGAHLDHVWVAIHSCRPQNACQQAVYSEVLSRYNDLSDMRTSRLSTSRARIRS